MPALILVVTAVALLTDSTHSQDLTTKSRDELTPPSSKAVKELQTKRIATLKELADLSTRLFQAGVGLWNPRGSALD